VVVAQMTEYDHFLHMARAMKAGDDEIRAAIYKVTEAQHGVVALVFSNHGRDMEIQILDEPFDSNVRVYPGE
jgi:hypothetical protein